jgi:hypothetical protein
VSETYAKPPESLPLKETATRRCANAGIAAGWRLMWNEIETIRAYVDSVDAALKREAKEFDDWVANQVVGLSERPTSDFCEHHAETADNLTRRFPEFVWRTTFVAIYSLLEEEMVDIARTVGRDLGIELDPDDLRDNGILAAKKYLQCLCGIAFPEGKHPWQEAIHYKRLRDSIVHYRGCLNRANHSKGEQIEKYVNGKRWISIDCNRCLQLSKEFCLEVLENAETLLDDLYKLAQERCNAAAEAAK